jgi:hypothetical protein
MESPLDEMKGAFIESLTRNNKKIREDRAIAIAEETELLYKREVENLTIKIKQLNREREGLTDLSPTTADSLILASDFDAETFVKKHNDLGVSIRQLEIRLEVATEGYNQLFTDKNKQK